MTNPLKKLKNTAIRLNLKYQIKREYFTVAVPACLAVLYIIVSLYQIGYIGPSNEAKDATKNNISLDNFKEGDEITVEQLQKLAEARQKKEDPRRDRRAESLSGIGVFAVLIAITPYSADLFFKRRRIRQYEDDYAEYLFQMSEMMRGGIDPVKATIELSKTNLGSITGHMQVATARMSYGRSFEYSMKELARSLQSRLIQRYTELLIHASYTGGNVAGQLMKSSEDMKKFIALEREKEGSLRMYVIIMYMAQGLLLMIACVFVYNVLPSLQNVNVGMFIQGATGYKISKTAIMFYITHIILINAFFVGLISGKVSTGSVKNGLKHTVALLFGSYAVVSLIITPQISGVEELKITPVSYPKTAFGGSELDQPVIFKVTDLKDKPLENISLSFKVGGPSEGKIKKAELKTDKDGLIRVYPILSIEPGKYSIEASYNENKGVADIEVIPGAGGE